MTVTGSTLLALLIVASVSIRNVDASSAAGAQGMPPSSSVVELNLWTFRGSVGDGRLWFVEFYVPWCRGCKRMVGEYDKLAEAFLPNRDVVVARFDCMQDEAMCEGLGVDRTPTLKLFLHGKVVETYKADLYFMELMGPFLERMYEKYIRAPNASAAAAGSGSGSSTPAAVPAADNDGGTSAAASGGSDSSGAAAAAAPPANLEAGSTILESDAGAAGPGSAVTNGGADDIGGGGGEQQQQQPGDVIEATPVQPGVYDKPAGAAASLAAEGDADADGGGGAAPGDVPVGDRREAAAVSVRVVEGIATTVSAAAEAAGPSGADGGDGCFGEPLARRGRQGGPAVETLRREREEL